MVQYGKITDFKYLIPDSASGAYTFDNPSALSLDELDDTSHMGFATPSQSDAQENSPWQQGSNANPVFRQPGAPDLSDLDETF